MRALVASSVAPLTADAVLEVGARLRALGFKAGRPASAIVFASEHHAAQPAALNAALQDMLGDLPFVGVFGASAFHEQRIPEKRPGLAVLMLLDVVGSVTSAPLVGFGVEIAARLLADAPLGTARFLAVGAPALSPTPPPAAGLDFVHALDEQEIDVLGAISVGGAEGARVLGSAVDDVPSTALLSLNGPRIVAGVSQAARTLGRARTITAATDNLIQELDGRPAVEALMADLPASLRTRLPRLGGALFAGIDADGDGLLLRHIVGLDPNTGALALPTAPRIGDEVVFSLRDQATARRDLEAMLTVLQEALRGRAPHAFVVLSSSARDEGLLGAPLWDVTRVLQHFGPDIPVVGASGAGELCSFGRGTHLFGLGVVVAAIL